jgi:hypothetical protein
MLLANLSLPADRGVLGPAALALLHHRRRSVACDDNGVASFDLVRHHRANESIFLYAFDLIELVGPLGGGSTIKRRFASKSENACKRAFAAAQNCRILG